jgi:hypothetical protein
MSNEPMKLADCEPYRHYYAVNSKTKEPYIVWIYRNKRGIPIVSHDTAIGMLFGFDKLDILGPVPTFEEAWANGQVPV